MRKQFPFLFCLFAVLALHPASLVAQHNGRSIQFAGLEWYVKASPNAGPGPNPWSDSTDSVYVDDEGNLHLMLRQIDGVWHSAEVYTTERAGYGQYIFDVQTPIGAGSLDPNVVLGMFVYADDNGNEIDIEVSQFGDAMNPKCHWYTVQPYTTPGNQHSFCEDLSGPSRWSFEWHRERVTFATYSTDNTPQLIEQWSFTDESQIPLELREFTLRINLWLFNGNEPTNGEEVEVVISAQNTSFPALDEQILHLAPANESNITTSGEYNSVFSWAPRADAEWYQLWVGPSDYKTTILSSWYAANDSDSGTTTGTGVCNDGTCTTPIEVWLLNDDYEWWMTFWGPERTEFDQYWHRIPFTIDFDNPSTSYAFVQPTGTVHVPPDTLVWEHDPTVLWYQIWVGPADYSDTLVFEWVNASQICGEEICTFDTSTIEFTVGTYEWWMEAWGPGGYIGWTDAINNPGTFELPNIGY